jgi:ABC transporter DrrB family efflux protein
MTVTLTPGPILTPPAATPGVTGLRQGPHDVWVITRRNIKRIVRTPQLLAFASIQPVIFVILFRYVFGGAIHAPGMSYADYLMPGIFIESMLFGTTTAVALATDLRSGIVDRFRSLPISRAAVLFARTLADLTRNVVVLAILVAVGTAVGFGFHNGAGPAIAALALVLVISFVYCWVLATVGLVVKDPETAQVMSTLTIIPFIFGSSAFVPVATMPGWLQAFAANQPVSVVVNAVRALTQGGPVYHWLWLSAAWFGTLLIVFVPLAVSRYRRV